MALSYTDLKRGAIFILDGDPYEVLEYEFLRMQQRKPVVRTKIRNLKTGTLYERSFQPHESFSEAQIEKRPVVFLYGHRGEYVFSNQENPQERFTLKEDAIGENRKWLKPKAELIALFFEGKLLNLTVPIKMDFKVTDAPPGLKGERSQAGTKAVTIETGTIIQAPLFINTGDVIRVNTESGEYVERVEKGG